MINDIKKNQPFYEKQKWYSITINPDDKHQFLNRPNRLELVKNKLYEEFITLRASKIHYRYSIDISEPRENIRSTNIGPRIHLHGRILFPCMGSILEWQLKHIYSITRWANLDIDTVKDTKEWDAYCDKYNPITKLKPYSSFELEMEHLLIKNI